MAPPTSNAGRVARRTPLHASDTPVEFEKSNLRFIESNVAYKLSRWPCRVRGCAFGASGVNKIFEHARAAHGAKTDDDYREHATAPYEEQFIPVFPSESRAAKARFADAVSSIETRMCRVGGRRGCVDMGVPDLNHPWHTRLRVVELTRDMCQ
eukprot:gene13496-10360_t